MDIDRLRGQGKTVILIGNTDCIKGVIGIRDEIRPNASEVIQELHKMGIKAIMLTEDSEIVAGAISRELGVDEFRRTSSHQARRRW